MLPSRSEQSGNLFDQQFFVAPKTRYHGPPEALRHYSIEMQRMPGCLPKKAHECKLAPAIAVTKGMDGIERRQEDRGATCELLSR